MHTPKDVVDCANHLIDIASKQGLCPPFTIPYAVSRKRSARADKVDLWKRRNAPLPNFPLDEAFNQCIPLVSVSPIANPYHELLTGIPIDQVVGRIGSGIAIPLDNAIHCAPNTQACPWSQTKEMVLTTGVQLAVTNGNVNTITKSNTTNWSKGNTDTSIQAITDILDQSWSKATLNETSGSSASDMADTLTKTHENSTTYVSTHMKDTSTTNIKTWNNENSNSNGYSDGDYSTSKTGSDFTSGWASSNETDNSASDSNKVEAKCDYSDTNSVKAGVSVDILGIFSIGISVTTTQTTSTSATFSIERQRSSKNATTISGNGGTTTFNTHDRGSHHNTDESWGTVDDVGGSNAITSGHSESDSTETRVGDSVADAYTWGITNITGWARSNTDTYGTSVSHSQGTDTSKGTTDNAGGDLTNSTAATLQTSIETVNSTSVTHTIATTSTIYVPPGQCLVPVCKPDVSSIVTPWLCKADGKVQIFTTEVQTLKTLNAKNNISCTLGFVGCNDPVVTFSFNQNRYKINSLTNVLRSDQIHVPGATALTSPSGEYTLLFITSTIDNSYSNLVYKHLDTVIWQTGITNLQAPPGHSGPTTRFRITLDGHLVQEAIGVYNDGNQSAWTTVWSNVPIHLDRPVGVYGAAGYTLFLQDDGELELLDGANVRIWSSYLSSTKLGFKFPYDSIYPSVNPTDGNEPRQVDPHNSFPDGITSLGTDTLTANCSSVLGPNQSIVSTNGRFAFILRDTGNLVLKDGVRTMWESRTADMWYAVPPYRATLSTADGAFRVKDSKDSVIWETQSAGGRTLRLNNVGNIVIFGDPATASAGAPSIRWNLRNETDPSLPIGFNVFKNPLVDCDLCSPCVYDGAAGPI
ncbi:hypothetical protein HK101_009196, partial [Irineochytrium annulatum]